MSDLVEAGFGHAARGASNTRGPHCFGGQQTVGPHKLAPPFKEAEFDIRWGKGIDAAGDLVDHGLAIGVIQKNGAHLAFRGEHIGHGRDRSREALLANGTLAAAVRAEVEATGHGPQARQRVEAAGT